MQDLTELFELDNLGEAYDYIEENELQTLEDREEN